MSEIKTTLYLLKLNCGHLGRNTFPLRLQFSNDYHLVKCSKCISLGIEWFNAWNNVTYQGELPSEMYNVLRRIPLILPEYIMRIQPNYQGKLAHKARPFPYVRPERRTK